MSAERGNLRMLRNAAAVGVGFGALLGGGDGLRTVIKDHRADTHHSATLHPGLRKVMEFWARSLGQNDPRLWPDAHLDHHAFADVRLFPFVRVSRAIDWIEQQKAQDNDPGVKIPSRFFNLDPQVPEYSVEQVRKIGGLAEAHAREKLGDLYVPPESYTAQELENIFFPEASDYHYKDADHLLRKLFRRRGPREYTSDELAAQVLGDPHSPAYADPKRMNGVKRVLLAGTVPYLDRIAVSKAHPEIISPHVPGDLEPKSALPAMATGVLLPGVAVLLGRLVSQRKLEGKDFALAAVASAVSTATRVVFVTGGSMAVNSLGHSGDGEGDGEKDISMMRAATSQEFVLKPGPEGELSTNFKPRGVLRWLGHVTTMDEVFRQRYHHKNPHRPAYTDETGLRGVLEAPVGMAIQAVIDSKSTLIEPGDNFGLEPGQRRPDDLHPAAVEVYAARIARPKKEVLVDSVHR